MESLLLVPAHFPTAVVVIHNSGGRPCDATVSLVPPEDWQVDPAERQVSVPPGEPLRVLFSLRGRSASADNWYPFTVRISCNSQQTTHHCRVPVTTAPYSKPVIDGQIGDWADAVPVAWTTSGKRTTVSTLWNRQFFCVLVAVEENRLVPWTNEGGLCDAVQLALSPRNGRTSTDPVAQTDRYEFLLVTTGVPGEGKCFLLASPGDKLGDCQKCRELGPLLVSEAQVAVVRDGGITYWECALPFGLMRSHIRPGEGREFCFSLLIHDPDGTGLRDWGQAAGLGPDQRKRLAWSHWPGAQWGSSVPMDNKTPWGMCSSKY